MTSHPAAVVGRGTADWQPIETAPKDGTRIRATRHAGGRRFIAPAAANEFAWSLEKNCWMQRVGKDWHRQFFKPTHWMPATRPLSPDLPDTQGAGFKQRKEVGR